jgi:hypothetical protein
MLNEHILQSIECAISHKCCKGTTKCAECDIGYKFIACAPVPIQCGHHICKQCEAKTREASVIGCKFCRKKATCTGGLGVAAESLFQLLLKDLIGELRDKYEKTFQLLGRISFLFINKLN